MTSSLSDLCHERKHWRRWTKRPRKANERYLFKHKATGPDPLPDEDVDRHRSRRIDAFGNGMCAWR
jgi:hypothetical protein